MGEGTLSTVTDAIDAAKDDIVTIGGAIIVVAAAVFAIRWVKAQFF